MVIDDIQSALKEHKLNGWLFFDHHQRDPLAYRILQLPLNIMASRRWYYFIPAYGDPQKLVHRIESGNLDTLPGRKHVYSSWQEQREKLGAIIAGISQLAMEYSPNCAIPYVSLVDGGTIELVKSTGATIVSSADLVQQFESTWSETQLASHLRAGKLVDQVLSDAFRFIADHIRMGAALTEFDVQQFILRRFSESGLMNDHGPIVAANENASDPHYEPIRERSKLIRASDSILIDLWAKLADPADAVYYDITWTGFCGQDIPSEIQNVFEVVRGARRAASSFVSEQISSGRQLAGFQVDDVARGFINGKGYGEHFFHRTGHNIGTEVHGTGANMDNLESHDERRIIADTCFSIEPGVYLPKFGIRSEVNVFVGKDRAFVTGEQQEGLVVCA